ncbi:hypothetical protein BpHYR1_015876 [Brachionus plicatilis]|uniref:Uncharacterized protein n=1 Tax=Brachionus plicatilis TaxID=10195 RepID=A0A3M7QWF7_BRAPC|nr:hypothetical protein BpHYR1_015876 [Brachionus plicatilis]
MCTEWQCCGCSRTRPTVGWSERSRTRCRAGCTDDRAVVLSFFVESVFFGQIVKQFGVEASGCFQKKRQIGLDLEFFVTIGNFGLGRSVFYLRLKVVYLIFEDQIPEFLLKSFVNVVFIYLINLKLLIFKLILKLLNYFDKLFAGKDLADFGAVSKTLTCRHLSAIPCS